MKREAARDGIHEELHGIRRKHHEETRRMSPRERVAYYRRKAQCLIEKHHLQLERFENVHG